MIKYCEGCIERDMELEESRAKIKYLVELLKLHQIKIL